MSPEAQRIAIAEACEPYVYTFDPERLFDGCFSEWRKCHPDGTRISDSAPPDYMNDLNAMHEAEKVLRPNDGIYDWPLWDKYIEYLLNLTRKYDLAHASAAQRAEAFLRTIGKWEDDK